jgi:site-specific DNA recombinase
VLRGVIYTRVSTDKQEDVGTSLDTQVENCTNFAIANNIAIVATFREVFTGGLYRERPLLTKLREMARNREIDCIIINTFDRLSRSQTHLAVIVDEMTHLGIEIVCVKEKFDDTASGQFMRSAMAFVAQVEREKIAERTDTGRRRRMSEGKIMPGWKARYGYTWAGEKKERFVLNPEEAEVIGKIFRLYAYEKGTLRGIAKLLSDEGILSPGGKAFWNDSTVRRILEDPTYIGRASAFKYDTITGRHNGKHVAKLKPEEDNTLHLYSPVLVLLTADRAGCSEPMRNESKVCGKVLYTLCRNASTSARVGKPDCAPNFVTFRALA